MLALLAVPVHAAEDDDLDLDDLSLEDLLEVEVTSVSRRAESWGDAPAAIFVLTAEDIRRSGHTSIPELLRMVPGLHVAHIDGNKWAIASRGFNERFTNKLLVLIDGRSVYTPLFGGVYWDVQDTLIEDIERIEVIRGPGATVWGANAVNGVINILTKRAEDTQGGLVVAGGGDRERGFAAFRYGGEIGENAHGRFYAKTFKREPFINTDGEEAEDEWDQIRSGFRIDWDATERDQVTAQGDIYWGDSDGEAPDTFLTGLSDELDSLARIEPDRNDLGGGNVLGRWTHTLSEDSDLQLQVYYDRTERNTLTFNEDRDTIDVDFQHHTSPLPGHDLVWGLGYRWTSDSTEGTALVDVVDSHRHDHLYSAFVQDQIEIFDDRFWITVGTKLEHNSYTGWEFQPSGRFLWKLFEDHTIWGSVSRAVKTPTRADEDIEFQIRKDLPRPDGFSIPFPPITGTVFVNPPGIFVPFSITLPPFEPESIPLEINVIGDKDFDSTVLYAYELGYRFTPTDRLWFDLSLYYNDYRRLDRSAERIPVTLAPNAQAPIDFNGSTLELVPTGLLPPDELLAARILDNFQLGSRYDGQAYGAELAASWQVLDWWRLSGGYSFLNVNVDHDLAPGIDDDSAKNFEVRSPSHQFHVRSVMNLPHDLELDGAMYWVGHTGRADSYLRADLRLGWKPCDGVELSLVGQNLFERSHPEWSSAQAVVTTEVPRSFYGKVTFGF